MADGFTGFPEEGPREPGRDGLETPGDRLGKQLAGKRAIQQAEGDPYFNQSDTLANRPTSGKADRLFVDESAYLSHDTGSAWQDVKVKAADSATSATSATTATTADNVTFNHALWVDEKNTNTGGGTASTGTWHTRTLNTERFNTISGASLSSNQFTLPAGTYLIMAQAPAYVVDRNKAAIYNITDTQYETGLIGMSVDAYRGCVAPLTGLITIASSKVFELRHYTQSARSTDGLGRETNATGIKEIYSTVYVRKIA